MEYNRAFFKIFQIPAVVGVVLYFYSSPVRGAEISCEPVAPGLVAAGSAPAPTAHRLDATRLDGDWDGSFMIGKQPIWEEFSVRGPKVSVRTFLGPLADDGVATQNGRSIHFSLGEHGQVEGQVDPQGLRMTGVWTRPDAPPTALNLMRRPQTPVAPFPYTSTDVTYTSADGAKIAGTVTSPGGQQRKAAVILIVGSQPADRNYVALGGSPAHKPFAVLADNLTRHGFVVLRYDERGVGLSDGDAFGATEAQKEDDVLAGIKLLASRSDVDPKKIGLIGHSAGGVTVGRLAATNPSVAFAILLSSPALPLIYFEAEQARSSGVAKGLTGADLERRVQLLQRLDAAVVSADSVSAARSNATAVVNDFIDPKNPMSRLTHLAEIEEASSDYYRFLLAHDPRDELKMLRKPILFIQGDQDQNISAAHNFPAIEGALADDKLATVCLISNLNHQLRYTVSGSNRHPEDSVETINAGVLYLVDSWLTTISRQPH